MLLLHLQSSRVNQTTSHVQWRRLRDQHTQLHCLLLTHLASPISSPPLRHTASSLDISSSQRSLAAELVGKPSSTATIVSSYHGHLGPIITTFDHPRSLIHTLRKAAQCLSPTTSPASAAATAGPATSPVLLGLHDPSDRRRRRWAQAEILSPTLASSVCSRLLRTLGISVHCLSTALACLACRTVPVSEDSTRPGCRDPHTSMLEDSTATHHQ